MNKVLEHRNLWLGYGALLIALDIYAWNTGIARFYSLQTVWAVTGLVALAGYIFQRAIAWRLIWKIYFILQVAGAVFFAYLIQQYYSDNGAGSKSLFFTLNFLFQIPYWYALWAYAFRSAHLWQDRS